VATDPDQLTEIILKHCWAQVSEGGLAVWRRTQDYNFYDQGAVDAVFALLQRTHEVQVRSADIPFSGPATTTVLGVGLQHEVPVHKMLGLDAWQKPAKLGPSGETITGKTFTYMTEPVVSIYVIASSKDIIRMMVRFVKTAMASYGQWFHQQGLEAAPSFVDVADMKPFAEGEGREAAVRFVRRITYMFKAVDRLTPFDTTPPVTGKYALVHVEGSVVSNRPDLANRTFTPVSPISLGGVEPRSPSNS
jgi:hypothetical protein